ncbi:membrane-bound metal-dependent hydrolase [Candidatus Magnetomorum sp. HK-1]|nr:membrane-bound metal-dependent hydrolase [Candidatus Magnetomorum sp. HK-1]
MADFKTHLGTASVVSMISATVFYGSGTISPQEVVLCFCLGTFSGTLPDIDSDTSTALKNFFNFLAVFLAFLFLFARIGYLSIIEMMILWAAIFSLVRYGLFKIFTWYTVHRGLFHSIPAAMASGLFVSLVCNFYFQMTPMRAWMCGFFVMLGYISHLVLDEIYSIELSSARIKWTFGSACKLFSLDNWHYYVYLYILVGVLFYLAPDSGPFFDQFTSGRFAQGFTQNFFPKKGWFSAFY